MLLVDVGCCWLMWGVVSMDFVDFCVVWFECGGWLVCCVVRF